MGGSKSSRKSASPSRSRSGSASTANGCCPLWKKCRPTPQATRAGHFTRVPEHQQTSATATVNKTFEDRRGVCKNCNLPLYLAPSNKYGYRWGKKICPNGGVDCK